MDPHFREHDIGENDVLESKGCVRDILRKGWNILRNKTKGTKKRNCVLELKEKRESLRPERRRGPPVFIKSNDIKKGIKVS
ncbi:MAG: hypothetical protein BGO77_03260 [Caedibacter sp. 37-49]|nr:MAG: hypothetical protein BGO77_03260 [Caedibacter sp. 37-49]